MNTLERTRMWKLVEGTGPLIATAIHDGHAIRPEIADLLAISDQDRLREEDPYTGPWTQAAGTRVVVLRSRFEIDLNRPREKAVYRTPEDAWGLHVWRDTLPDGHVEESLASYDAFYKEMRRLFVEARKRHGRFVVFDLHTYNHRRRGPTAPPEDPEQNPEVNIGTGTMERTRWAGLVDRFIRDLRSFDFGGRPLDVRENVRFRGGHLPRWTHRNFPETGCALAIELKKFFMDEWTGTLEADTHSRILEALSSTVPGILEELGREPAV